MCVYYRWQLERKMNKKKGRGTDRKQIVHIVDCGCELSQLSVLRKILTHTRDTAQWIRRTRNPRAPLAIG